ncbi:MAG: hypothetical protein NDJ90_08160 [Oligoflexia bacterium]|nr:hypothetical protein [Oligoflexia bacterium]
MKRLFAKFVVLSLLLIVGAAVASVVAELTPVAHAAPPATPAPGKVAHPSIEPAAEDWKGKGEDAQFGVGLLSGLAIVDSTAGFSILVTGSHQAIPEGFIPDINDAVWMELTLGPTLLSGSNAFFYSTHLRWDFIKDAQWKFYTLAGLAGFITDSELGNSFEIFPRMAAGAFWKVSDVFHLRGELSHELIGVGVSFPL